MNLQTDTNEPDPTYRLLALCARAEGHPLFYAQLKEQLHAFKAWEELPAQAEMHGMSALLWHHIYQANLSIPLETEQTLRGLTIRQRAFTQAHTQVLLEITSLFEQAGIRALVLKGLALAYQYYPDPALRPISDIDFLLKKSDVLPALNLLAAAGFQVHSPDASQTLAELPEELMVDSPLRNGFSTHVEIHHFDSQAGLSSNPFSPRELDGLYETACPLLVGKSVIYTPNAIAALCYLSKHLRRHLFEATPAKPVQLKWVADIVSLVEHHAEGLDWDAIRQSYPALLPQLEVFYSLSPLPERLKNTIPVRQVPYPKGINQYPAGWPQQFFSAWRQTGFLRFFMQTFSSPSDWWLRVYYGIGAQDVFWYGRIVYPMQIIKRLFSILFQKVSTAAFTPAPD